eukprot:SAG22_NODE_2536_length_2465_cov_2.652578_1_plen_309_part_00
MPAFVAAEVNKKRGLARKATLAHIPGTPNRSAPGGTPGTPGNNGSGGGGGGQLPDSEAIIGSLAELPAALHELKQAVSKMHGGSEDEYWSDVIAEPAAEGFKALSDADIEIQKRIFELYDSDKNGQLSQLEVKRMLETMKLFDSVDELISVIKVMDADNSGTIELEEYLDYIDSRCEDAMFHRNYRAQATNLKLGYAGTTWRRLGNISWLSNQGIMILLPVHPGAAGDGLLPDLASGRRRGSGRTSRRAGDCPFREVPQGQGESDSRSWHDRHRFGDRPSRGARARTDQCSRVGQHSHKERLRVAGGC